MPIHTWRNAAIAVASAIATIAMVAAIILASGSIGPPVPGDEPILPAFETTNVATPAQDVAVQVPPTTPTVPTPSNCALYGGTDGLPILDTHRCLASDRVVTVE